LIVAGFVLLLGRGRRRRAPEPLEAEPFRASARDEIVVLGLLGAAALAALGFVGVYLRGASTQYLGLTLGLALSLLGVAGAVAAKRLVPQEKELEPRPELEDRAGEEEVLALLQEAGRGLTRKRLLLAGAGGALGALGAALVLPIASLGPGAASQLTASPWRRGRRLVDEYEQPLRADEIAVGSVRTAFPEGADKEKLASPLVVVRLKLDELDLPSKRRDWAPEGILAFSKICPHAGCAVSLFRYPKFRSRSPKPALVCPCHYSTFDVGRGGDRLFGPAGRALPQLPLALDASRNLIAAGDFSGRVGPSWLEVRQR
jgi:ubiquinol-cytochrome c reductase iron-sulfur subunit